MSSFSTCGNRILVAIVVVVSGFTWAAAAPTVAEHQFEPGENGGVAAADQMCPITIKGRNGGTTPIVVVFTSSDVRTRSGWWTKLKANRLTGRADTEVAAGGRFSVIYDTAFGCNASRKWRFAVLNKRDSRVAMKNYPSSSYTIERTIDLGDLTRLF